MQMFERLNPVSETAAIGPAEFEIIARSDGTWRGDETRRKAIVVARVGDTRQDVVEELVHDHFPAEHCTHAHDCCGRWYQGTAEVERQGGIAIITLPFYLNV